MIINSKKAKYICFEGTEGTGKTTQIQLLVKYLESCGHTVFVSKEPGTMHSPLTMELRKCVLDAQYDKHMTIEAREMILQAIRSIHINAVIKPALAQYDYIIQDRGQLSGLTYGESCGVDKETMDSLLKITLKDNPMRNMYDQIILLKGDVSKGLKRAIESKQEYESGDALENKGDDFISDVGKQYDKYKELFDNVSVVSVDNKSIIEVFEDIKKVII